MKNKKELLAKIKALAEKGIDGEKKNANILLNKLMLKYGISSSDLDSEHKKERVFKIKGGETYVRLLSQLAAHLGISGIYYYGRKRSEQFVLLTDSEFIELSAMFEFYSNRLKCQQKIFYKSFIIKNELFSKIKKDDNKSSAPDEDYLKAAKMAHGLERSVFLKQIE